MKRWIASLLLLAGLTMPAQAHFVWILPSTNPKELGKAEVVFSDELASDSAVPIKKIAGTELFLRGADGQKTKVKSTEGKASLVVGADIKEPQVLAGLTKYGVLKKAQDEPFLLIYHSKAILGWPFTAECCQPWHALALEIVPVLEGTGTKTHVAGVRVFWQGKPLAKAEVILLGTKDVPPIDGPTDAQGYFKEGFAANKEPGLHGLRVVHKEAKAGEVDGKKYAEVRHYATLVWASPAPGKETTTRPSQPDPLATKLLSEARAARASWAKFPGFIADLEVNFGGKLEKGRLEVNADGKVKVELTDKEMLPWVKKQLGSLVAHRLEGGPDKETPCAFTDGVRNHPVGRAITVLNDELHSSYRIRDKQILEVNRTMGEERFTITVLENLQNADKKFLPTSYVVSSWNARSGALVRSQAFHDTWTRIGGFDLPSEMTVVMARPATTDQAGVTAGGLDIRRITVSNHKLTK